jgi:hypothetical protein
MTKWEYKVETNIGVDWKTMTENPEPGLNKLGSEGWELIVVLQITRGGGSTMGYIFKRPA